ncbi:hypothetical protein G6O69_38805 [Pseudenhygromyxa sp. WMMC2535]|nr:hypothetical protein [Pseudenhygromyxa sp. WMMC2535]
MARPGVHVQGHHVDRDLEAGRGLDGRRHRVTWTSQHVPEFHPKLTHLPFTLIGLALSIFLGFRNNTGYDRFWEGPSCGGAWSTSRAASRAAAHADRPADDRRPGRPRARGRGARAGRGRARRAGPRADRLRPRLSPPSARRRLPRRAARADPRRAARQPDRRVQPPVAILQWLGAPPALALRPRLGPPHAPAGARGQPDRDDLGPGRLRAHQVDADPRQLHRADPPDRAALLRGPALRHRRSGRRVDAGGRGPGRLRFLWPRLRGHGDRKPLWQGPQRPPADHAVTDDRGQLAPAPGRRSQRLARAARARRRILQ